MNVRCRENPRPGPFSRLGPVPRPLASLLALALGAAMALGLAACGEEDAQLLNGETAREIVANLDTVELLADEGDCVGAESAAQQVSEQIEALEGVERELKQALERGAERLNEVIVECEEEPAETVAPAEPPSEEEGEEEEQPDKKKEKGDKGDEEPSDAETAPDTPTSPSLPPQAKGEAKGHEDGGGEEEDEEPSGGVSPSSPAGGGEE